MYPLRGFDAISSRSHTWNTGWHFMEAERSNLYALLEIFSSILNLLSRLKSNFEECCVV